jgi:hypothetical protein
MKNLQKIEGIFSIIASVTYIFVMALVLSVLTPMANANLDFQEYITFLVANKILIHI